MFDILRVLQHVIQATSKKDEMVKNSQLFHKTIGVSLRPHAQLYGIAIPFHFHSRSCTADGSQGNKFAHQTRHFQDFRCRVRFTISNIIVERWINRVQCGIMEAEVWFVLAGESTQSPPGRAASTRPGRGRMPPERARQYRAARIFASLDLQEADCHLSQPSGNTRPTRC